MRQPEKSSVKNSYTNSGQLKLFIHTQLQIQMTQNEQNTLQNSADGETTRKQTFLGIVEGTPFAIIQDGNSFFLALGNYALTPALQSEESCKNYLKTNQWEVTAALVAVVLKFNTENNI